MYIETSSPRNAGDNAKLELSVSGNGALSCLKFYYHMYGATIGTLNVFNGNSVVFSKSGNRGSYWIEATITIYLDSTITFEGIAGSSFTGDIAIDDVSITNGSCINQTAAPPSIPTGFTQMPNASIPTSSPAVTSCNFDYNLCYGWQQSYSDVFNWTRHTGSTPSFDTGPSSDHTTGYGYYMYIETSYPRVAGDNAKLVLSVSGNGALSCLKFYYHMYGDTMGTLTVFNGNTVVFNTSGNHSNFWVEARRTIYLDSTITFEGIAGSSFTGDLAIDDVSISSGSCYGQTAAPPSFPTGFTQMPNASIPTSSPAVTSCNFDYNLCYGWQQSYSDVFDWMRYTGSTESIDTGPSSDHTTGYGYYMYIETSPPRVAGDNAKLELSVSGNGALSCLKFYYHMYGASIGTLNVYNGNAVVFNASGNHGNYWIKAEINIFLDSTITFEGIAGSSYTGDIAIDDISISSGSCYGQTATPPSFPTGFTQMPNASIPTSSPVATSCNFDFYLCSGWQQSYSDVFDWTRHTGSTSSIDTGPSSDHTTGYGYYMYIETSSPRVAGDNAKLELSVSGNGALSCLKFYYHMYGDTIGTLNVYNGKAVVFKSSGSHGNNWIKAEINIFLDSTVRVYQY
ncbi:hypothetical protein ACROYT_G040921 [Oculina patagonica]